MALHIRRVVTGHDDQGRAIVCVDEICRNVISRRPRHQSCVIWSTGTVPADNSADANGAARELGTPQPNATVFRIVEYQPGVAARVHRTESIDYAVVLSGEIGGTAERDPHLDTLAHMTLEAETVEEKVFQMQVFYERLIISRFRLIARSSRGTVLEDLCNRLTTDAGIHHGAGMAYEKVLLQNASKQTKQRLVDAANRLLPEFAAHALWRPRERAWIGRAMESRDVERLKEDLEIGVRLAESLGLDVGDVEMPF